MNRATLNKNDRLLIASTIRSSPPLSFTSLSLDAPFFAHYSVVLIQNPPLTKHGTAVRPLVHLPFVLSRCHLSPETGMFLCDPVRSRFTRPYLIACSLTCQLMDGPLVALSFGCSMI
jgi:hypothetical protein